MSDRPPLLFAATTDLDKPVGGWGGIGQGLLRGLEARLGPALRVNCGDIRPSKLLHYTDKGLRVFRLPRPMVAYSNGLLQTVARRVESRSRQFAGTPVFFTGGAVFAMCQPSAPYYVYVDGHFLSLIRDYIPHAGISKTACDRVARLEGAFMSDAAGVFVSSQWMVDQIRDDYDVDPTKLHFVGVGPGPTTVQPAGAPTYEPFLLFMATDAKRKRVDLAVESVRAARRKGANLTLTIIGEHPGEQVVGNDFVNFLGWLSPRNPEHRQTLVRLFSTCLAHFLPTRADLTPLSIIEAAIFRKATVATAVGGIPDMIRHDVTGILCPADASADSVAAELVRLAASPAHAAAMGEAAYQSYLNFWNWDSTLDRITRIMSPSLKPSPAVPA